jgi:hypothetical protein
MFHGRRLADPVRLTAATTLRQLQHCQLNAQNAYSLSENTSHLATRRSASRLPPDRQVDGGGGNLGVGHEGGQHRHQGQQRHDPGEEPTSSGNLDRGLRARFIAWSHFPEPTSSTTDTPTRPGSRSDETEAPRDESDDICAAVVEAASDVPISPRYTDVEAVALVMDRGG